MKILIPILLILVALFTVTSRAATVLAAPVDPAGKIHSIGTSTPDASTTNAKAQASAPAGITGRQASTPTAITKTVNSTAQLADNKQASPACGNPVYGSRDDLLVDPCSDVHTITPTPTPTCANPIYGSRDDLPVDPCADHAS